jgi:hypothetical protein
MRDGTFTTEFAECAELEGENKLEDRLSLWCRCGFV